MRCWPALLLYAWATACRRCYCLRAQSIEHFSEVMIGAMMSGYYAGFIAGTFICPWLIARVGHIRVFAASCAGACAVMLIHALFIQPWIWIALRILYGLCLVHLFTVMESWLNSIGEKGTRGKILSCLYDCQLCQLLHRPDAVLCSTCKKDFSYSPFAPFFFPCRLFRLS